MNVASDGRANGSEMVLANAAPLSGVGGGAGVPDIERQRRHFGLSRSQTWELLQLGRPLWQDAAGDGASDGAVDGGSAYSRTKMFDMWNGEAPVPAWVTRGVEWLTAAYDTWKAAVLEQVRTEGDTPGRLSTYELSRVLGMTDYYVYELRFNGTLSYTGKEGRAFTYTAADVEKLFATCEQWVEGGRPVGKRQRGLERQTTGSKSILGGNNSPLARSFMRTVKRRLRQEIGKLGQLEQRGEGTPA